MRPSSKLGTWSSSGLGHLCPGRCTKYEVVLYLPVGYCPRTYSYTFHRIIGNSVLRFVNLNLVSTWLYHKLENPQIILILHECIEAPVFGFCCFISLKGKKWFFRFSRGMNVGTCWGFSAAPDASQGSSNSCFQCFNMCCEWVVLIGCRLMSEVSFNCLDVHWMSTN